jgi:hypothetical protein
MPPERSDAAAREALHRFPEAVITSQCTRPRTRRLSSSFNGLARRVIGSVRPLLKRRDKRKAVVFFESQIAKVECLHQWAV